MASIIDKISRAARVLAAGEFTVKINEKLDSVHDKIVNEGLLSPEEMMIFESSWAEAIDETDKRALLRLFHRKAIETDLDVDEIGNAMFSSYSQVTQLQGDRKKRYADYNDMDEDTLCSTSLDIYASESFQPNMDKEDARVWVTAEEEEVQSEFERLFEEVDLDSNIWGLARNVAKFGDDFNQLLSNKSDGIVSLNYLDPESVEVMVDKYMRLKGFKTSDNMEKELEPWSILHTKIISRKNSPKKGGSAYGMSFLEPCRRVWRQLKLLEDALIIYRLDQGTRHRVFYIDVGNASHSDALKIVRDWRREFRKRTYYDPTSGIYTSRHQPLSIDSDMYMPVREGSTQRVESIGGNINVTDVADIDYFLHKMYAALKIPAAYIGGDEYSSVRYGLSQIDINFARIMKLLQSSVVRSISLMCLIHYAHKEDKELTDKDYKIHCTPISYLEQQQRVELLSASVDLAQRMFPLGQMLGLDAMRWTTYVLTRILGFQQTDLEELGLDGEGNDPGEIDKQIDQPTRDKILSSVQRNLALRSEYRYPRIHQDVSSVRVPRSSYKLPLSEDRGEYKTGSDDPLDDVIMIEDGEVTQGENEHDEVESAEDSE